MGGPGRARDEVLGAIRGALAGQAGMAGEAKPAAIATAVSAATASVVADRRSLAAPAPEPMAPAAADPAALLASFQRNAQEAGAHVHVVRYFTEARVVVAQVLDAIGARVTLVTPGAAAPQWRCTGAGARPGVRFVTRHERGTNRDDLLVADAGVTVATYGLADTGTLVVCASPDEHRLDSLLPATHIALLTTSCLLPDLRGCFARLQHEGRFAQHSAVTFIRGPSRTADIEFTLTIGVHGPQHVHIVVVDDQAMAHGRRGE